MNGSDRPRREPPGRGLELAALIAGVVAAGVGLVTWAGARLAAALSGGRVGGGLTDWLGVAVRLVQRPGDPRWAWEGSAAGLPGPVLYWACTVVAALVTAGLVVGGVRLWRRLSSSHRQRFGSPTDAQLATSRDVRPLVVRSTIPPTGRLLLGRQAGLSGPLLATEDAHRHPLPGRSRRRQGDRGSVALIGPTRSGKTVLAAAGIVGWDGPVVALSLKRDLYDATAAGRAGRGEVAVFDPSGVTGLPTARWSPLRDVTTTTAALRAARALAHAIPRVGVQSGDFWSKHGEAFCSAFLALAGLSQLLPSSEGSGGEPVEPLTIEMLATWTHLQVGVREPRVNDLIRRGLGHDDINVQLLARHAMTQLMALDREDPRIKASIYATARLAVEAWLEPAVAHSASDDPRPSYDAAVRDRFGYRPRWVDLDWLMGKPDDGRTNTLYIAAPDTEFARLAPVIGGLLGDLREQIHAQDVAGRRLAKPVLLVIDEAGQLELQWLPAAVSTLAGLGVILVTCWQSRSQITDLYGNLADTVLTGHRSKVFFAGLDDPSSAEYLTKMAGAAYQPVRGWSAEVHGGHRSVSEHLQRDDLIPAHLTRQMQSQQAVLLHGTLPPIHLQAVRWWEDGTLSRHVPIGHDGRPEPPADITTCPLSSEPAILARPAVDPNTVAASQLPTPSQSGTSASSLAASGGSGDTGSSQARGEPGSPSPGWRRPASRSGGLDGQSSLPFADGVASDRVDTNRVAGSCTDCGTWLKVSEGRARRYGKRTILTCYPTCSPER